MGQSCFHSGDFAFTKKLSRVILRRWMLLALWLLEDGRFVDVSCVNTKYRSAYERFSTCYRTIHHIVRERDWQDYPAEEVADAFEDISR